MFEHSTNCLKKEKLISEFLPKYTDSGAQIKRLRSTNIVVANYVEIQGRERFM